LATGRRKKNVENTSKVIAEGFNSFLGGKPIACNANINRADAISLHRNGNTSNSIIFLIVSNVPTYPVVLTPCSPENWERSE
jgi:hypothetical protein